MILEILEWLQLASAKKVTAQSASNLFLIAYTLVTLQKKRAAFIVAFISCEAFAKSIFSDWASDELFYLSQAAIYCCLYHYIFLTDVTKIKTLLSCVIIVLFDLGMAIDAAFYPEVETALYNSYEFIVVAVHGYLISTLIDWRRVKRISGHCASFVSSIVHHHYNFAFVWYNLRNINIKNSKQ